MRDPKVVGFIFARGGSKGLPRKNLKLLNGLSLLARSIKISKSIDKISAVYVSTDDPEIKDEAVRYGANVIDRPLELAQDNSPEWLSWQHAVEHVEKELGRFDVFVSLPVTSPLRLPEDIICCIKALRSDIDSLITVREAGRNLYFNMVAPLNEGSREVRLVIDRKDITRRQDAPICYDMATVGYVTRPSFIKNHRSIWDGKVGYVEIPVERSVDIDNAFDLEMAEYFGNKLNIL